MVLAESDRTPCIGELPGQLQSNMSHGNSRTFIICWNLIWPANEEQLTNKHNNNSGQTVWQRERQLREIQTNNQFITNNFPEFSVLGSAFDRQITLQMWMERNSPIQWSQLSREFIAAWSTLEGICFCNRSHSQWMTRARTESCWCLSRFCSGTALSSVCWLRMGGD